MQQRTEMGHKAPWVRTWVSVLSACPTPRAQCLGVANSRYSIDVYQIDPEGLPLFARLLFKDVWGVRWGMRCWGLRRRPGLKAHCNGADISQPG